MVLDGDRNPTSLSARGGAFFRAEIFSQNDIETIADHSKFQLRLIDSFARDEIAAEEQHSEEIEMEIVAHAKKVEPLAGQIATTGCIKRESCPGLKDGIGQLGNKVIVTAVNNVFKTEILAVQSASSKM